MTPTRRLDDAFGRWAFDREPGDWDDVLRRAAHPGWGDVLRRVRRPLRLRRRSRRTPIGVGALLALAGPALGLVAAKQTLGRDATEPGPRLTGRSPQTDAQRLHGGSLFSNCRFSHTAPDDPLVFPGQPGRSHLHTFFGNTSTNAHSTPRTPRRAGTTCRPRSDTAAYSVPTLFRNGREVRPPKAQVYYVLRGRREMRAFPPGLRMIAGDAHAVRPQNRRITFGPAGATPRERVP